MKFLKIMPKTKFDIILISVMIFKNFEPYSSSPNQSYDYVQTKPG